MERQGLTIEQRVRRQTLERLRELARGDLPTPERNWDLIWVFAGAEGYHQNGTWVKKGINPTYQDIGNDINQSKTRLATAISIARQVTAMRVGKNTEDVLLEDIQSYDPKIFYNEWDWQNNDLRELFFEDDGEKQYQFPKENIIIPQNSQIMHTGHQFERFPGEILQKLSDNGKFILVSDLYHLPRIERYAWKRFSREIIDRVVLYPSQPLFGSLKLFWGEIRKVVEYGEKGDLVWSSPR